MTISISSRLFAAVSKGNVSDIVIRGICFDCDRPHGLAGLSDIEFEYLIKDIHPKHSILIFDQCCAGGFGTRLQARESFTIICRADLHERGTGEYFTRAFFRAFGDYSADTNNNGRISLGEVFSKTMQAIQQNDLCYKNGQYTPSIRGSLDVNEVYLDTEAN